MTEPAETTIVDAGPTAEDLSGAELEQVAGGATARNGNLQITQFHYGAAQPVA